jgi:hypothetical protein
MSNVTHTHSDEIAQVVDTPAGTGVDQSGSEPTVAVPSGWFSNGVSTGGQVVGVVGEDLGAALRVAGAAERAGQAGFGGAGRPLLASGVVCR